MMSSLTVISGNTRVTETQYILDVIIRDFFGLECAHQVVAGSDYIITVPNAPGSLHLPDVFLATRSKDWLHSRSLPRLPLRCWREEQNSRTSANYSSLPILYGRENADQAFRPGSAYLPIDVFGSAFFALTGYEEYVVTERDMHDRFLARCSTLFRASLLGQPIVDQYVELLWIWMRQLWPNLERKKREFRIDVSHDVDHPMRYGLARPSRILKRIGKEFLRQRKISAVIRGPRIWMNSINRIPDADPDNTFSWLMDISERYNLVSTFNFLTDVTDRKHDTGYRIDSRPIRQLMREIDERNHGIGLHPSYNSLLMPGQIRIERQRLQKALNDSQIRQQVQSSRNHYLRWREPQVLHELIEAGIKVDSTLSFAEQPGFRRGTCHPFQAFDLLSSKKLPIILKPLIAMEASILSIRYLGISDPREAISLIHKLRDQCSQVNGVFSLLWHNSTLSNPKHRYIYESAIS